jgi:hypothetical protein
VTTIAPPPSAAATPPPPISPGGRTAFRVVLIAAAAVLVAASIATLGVAAWGLSTFRVSTDTKNLPAAMRSLAIDTGDVPVAIRITSDRAVTEPSAKLRLINSTRAGDHQLDLNTDRDGSRITINGDSSSLLDWARGGEITITLPPEQARRLTVHTRQNTGVVLAQTDLDELVARTAHGQVVLGGAARSVEVHTVSGEVVTRDPISVTERFSATTSEGDIVLDFKDVAPRSVEVTSRDGDVVIGLPSNGPYLVRAQSGESTKVRVPETSDATAAVAEVTARSDNGDVVVEGVR